MTKKQQIIIRMTETEKKELEHIAKENDCNISSFVRKLVTDFIQQKDTNK